VITGYVGQGLKGATVKVLHQHFLSSVVPMANVLRLIQSGKIVIGVVRHHTPGLGAGTGPDPRKPAGGVSQGLLVDRPAPALQLHHHAFSVPVSAALLQALGVEIRAIVQHWRGVPIAVGHHRMRGHLLAGAVINPGSAAIAENDFSPVVEARAPLQLVEVSQPCLADSAELPMDHGVALRQQGHGKAAEIVEPGADQTPSPKVGAILDPWMVRQAALERAVDENVVGAADGLHGHCH